MKANEAPEKLYADIEDGFRDSFLYGYVEKRREDDIEYVRTDAFIEKACEYFRRNLEDTEVKDDCRSTLVRGIQARYTSVEEFIEDFKNYTKGD